MASFAMILLMLVSMLLILVILVQRGRGGGLAGAFGGQGGQSAFGTKAGDVFTRITIGLITVWVLLAGTSGVLARRANLLFNEASLPPASISSSQDGASDLSLPKATGSSSTEEPDTGAAGDASSSSGSGTTSGSDAANPADADKPGETETPKSDDAVPATDGNK